MSSPTLEVDTARPFTLSEVPFNHRIWGPAVQSAHHLYNVMASMVQPMETWPEAIVVTVDPDTNLIAIQGLNGRANI